ncbi:MAG: hypothetical protein AB7S70_15230, partial [Hyphomicrobium sp.]
TNPPASCAIAIAISDQLAAHRGISLRDKASIPVYGPAAARCADRAHRAKSRRRSDGADRERSGG